MMTTTSGKCKFCGKEITERSRKRFCSRNCKTKFNQSQSLIKYFTFNKECLGSELAFEEWNRVRDLLFDLYWNKGKSCNDIKEIFNYPNSSDVTGKIFNYLNIPKRTHSEANSNYLMHSHEQIEKYTQYKSGWHAAWNQKKVFLRSSYEFEFAKRLDRLHTRYTVEELRIEYFDTVKNYKRIAIPDFYISKENLIVEVKSNYTLNIQNMIDKAREYRAQGYNFLLFLENRYLTLKELENMQA